MTKMSQRKKQSRVAFGARANVMGVKRKTRPLIRVSVPKLKESECQYFGQNCAHYLRHEFPAALQRFGYDK